jgi:hypothetical protein
MSLFKHSERFHWSNTVKASGVIGQTQRLLLLVKHSDNCCYWSNLPVNTVKDATGQSSGPDEGQNWGPGPGF